MPPLLSPPAGFCHTPPETRRLMSFTDVMKSDQADFAGPRLTIFSSSRDCYDAVIALSHTICLQFLSPRRAPIDAYARHSLATSDWLNAASLGQACTPGHFGRCRYAHRFHERFASTYQCRCARVGAAGSDGLAWRSFSPGSSARIGIGALATMAAADSRRRPHVEQLSAIDGPRRLPMLEGG